MHTETITRAAVVAAVADTETPRYGATASGYGPKIPTRYRVRIDGDSPTARLRRVYAACYGNAASLYVVRGGQDVYIDATDVEVALERA